MRSVAPESPGSAASQKSWLVVNVNPTSGSFTTTTLQTIQTAKARSSAGMEIQRLRWRWRAPRQPRRPGPRGPSAPARGALIARLRAVGATGAAR